MSDENVPFDKWELKRGDPLYNTYLSDARDSMQLQLDDFITDMPLPSTTFELLTYYDENLINSYNVEYDESFTNLVIATEVKIKKDYKTYGALWDVYLDALGDLELFYDEDFYKDNFNRYLKAIDEKRKLEESAKLTAQELYKLMQPDMVDKREKGRPQHRNLKADQKLIKDWEKSRDAGITRDEFCKDLHININKLERARRNVNRDKNSRQK